MPKDIREQEIVYFRGRRHTIDYSKVVFMIILMITAICGFFWVASVV